MIPVEPELFNVVMGKGQDEYRDLPAFVDGQRVVTKWKFTAKEIETIVQNGHVYIAQFNQGNPLQPLFPSVDIKDVLTEDQYEAIDTYKTIEITQSQRLVNGRWFVDTKQDGAFETEVFQMKSTPCSVCGSEAGDSCWRGAINDDGVMKWRIHVVRLVAKE